MAPASSRRRSTRSWRTRASVRGGGLKPPVRLHGRVLEPDIPSRALAQLADRPAPEGVPAREQRQVLALDGKTVRGAHVPITSDTDTDTGAGAGAGAGAGGGYRQPHLVSVLDQATGAVLGQVQVEAKGSEVAAFRCGEDQAEPDGGCGQAQRGHEPAHPTN